MKQLLITIAAVVLVGCGPSVPDISIHEAAGTGNIDVVKQHLAAGTDVDAKDAAPWTPLHWAAREGHKEIVELLIAEGVDVNVVSDSGNTPLDGPSKTTNPKSPTSSANTAARPIILKPLATKPTPSTT